MKQLRSLVVIAAFCGTATAAQNSRLVVRSVGQFENANTVVYSIYVASRDEKLSELLISSRLPAGARFLDNVDTPAAARYEGVADNVVQWTLPSIEADTLVGPFNFRVHVDPSLGVPPSAPPFSVSYQSPVSELLDDAGSNDPIRTFAESGSITFDQRGSLDASNTPGLVEIGKTGIMIFVPAGAVSRAVTLTFTRKTVEDDKVPQNVSDTWWCAMYHIAISPQVEFAKPIVYAFPTRRALPPGLSVRQFASADQKDWTEVDADASAASSSKQPKMLGFGSFGNGCVSAGFGFAACTTTLSCSGQLGCGAGGGFGAFGVSQTARVSGSTTGAVLTQQLGQTVRPGTITDGTSNIIAILIGLLR